MSDRQKWESMLSNVIEQGHRKKRQRLSVAISTVMMLFLLIGTVVLYRPNSSNQSGVRSANAQEIQEMETELALLEEGIIVNDMGIIY